MRSRIVLLLGFILSTATSAWSAPTHDPDDQLWNELRLTYQLNEQFSVFSAGFSRLTNDFGEFGRAQGRCGFTWQPVPEFTIMPSYLYDVTNPADDASRAESRACLLLSYRIPVKTATVTVSNMTEYRMPEGAAAFWRLRPKVEVSHPLGPNDLGLTGFLASEPFYDNGRNAWTQNRLFGGLRKNLGKTTSIELYYCRELQFIETRPDLNIIGLSVRLTFGPEKLPPPDEPDLE